MITTPLHVRTITRPYLPKRKQTVTRASRQEITPAKVIEAVSGKSAIYGVILGTTNWVVADINPLQQLHYAEFIGLAVLCSSLSAISVDKSVERCQNIKEFEDTTYLKSGRVAMVIFASMLIGCSI